MIPPKRKNSNIITPPDSPDTKNRKIQLKRDAQKRAFSVCAVKMQTEGKILTAMFHI